MSARDVREIDRGVLEVFADEPTIEGILTATPSIGPARRLGADRAVVVVPTEDLGRANDRVHRLLREPDAFVEDATGGWAAVHLAAPSLAELSAVSPPLPGAVVAAPVAGVPALIVGTDTGYDVLVAAFHRAHLLDELARSPGLEEGS